MNRLLKASEVVSYTGAAPDDIGSRGSEVVGFVGLMLLVSTSSEAWNSLDMGIS
jgi:hypothetical protein